MSRQSACCYRFKKSLFLFNKIIETKREKLDNKSVQFSFPMCLQFQSIKSFFLASFFSLVHVKANTWRDEIEAYNIHIHTPSFCSVPQSKLTPKLQQKTTLINRNAITERWQHYINYFTSLIDFLLFDSLFSLKIDPW